MAAWMLYRCVFGPHLQRIHRSPEQPRPEASSSALSGMELPTQESGKTHRQYSWLGQYNILLHLLGESIKLLNESVIILYTLQASAIWSISYYSSPLLLCYLYRKGYICSSKLVPVSQYLGTVLVCLLGVACIRGWGRWRNTDYVQFISVLEETKKNHTPANKEKLRCFNFDFSHWPSDFSWTEVSSPKHPKGGVSLLKPEPRLRGTADGFLHSVRTLPCHVIGFLIAHSFGRRMLYPGSVGLLQKAMRPMLQGGQAKLIEEYDGERNKLVACDGNEIDTMFVDRRKDGGPRGRTLVICCEGNAGFYEVGCMNTPLEGGYSVLGWNHPGFAGSTGVPFPQNEANAMDVVIQFAVHKLGFQLSDIVIYAWSIGGFTASWAVMSYPEIQSIVLDASFDDLLPLALKVMPESWRPLVQHTVRQYMNLNNAEQLLKYQGPVLLVRRTRDEIITTTHPEDIMSNRGNDLLLRLLQFRYPKIMTEEGVRVVRQWLGASSPIEEASVYSGYEVDDDWCLSVLKSYQTDRDVSFPWSVGEPAHRDDELQTELRTDEMLSLSARKYMRNFESTHCTPLPAAEFHPPWRL
uniref:Abhydrolase domain containing 16A, phospholipase n=1 Tax=Xiphophorus maculatus TaxID=8083 RepID=A0A3B5R3P5_XIPMA